MAWDIAFTPVLTPQQPVLPPAPVLVPPPDVTPAVTHVRRLPVRIVASPLLPRPRPAPVGPGPGIEVLRAKRYADLRGLYRIFNYLSGADPTGWKVYHKVGSPPDQAPGGLWATSATEPFTPAGVLGDGVHYFSLAFWDGVLESNFRPIGPQGEPYLRLTISGGAEADEPPQAPDPWQIELRPSGVVRVTAFYTRAPDVPLGGAAEEWSLGVTYDGGDPPADTPTYTEAMAFEGDVARLAYDLPAQDHGTTVKVRLQTRRDDGSWTYSEASTVETATADATGPAAPGVIETWPGRLPEDL